MTRFCPVYPPPRKSMASRWWMFFRAQHSWFDSLSERSYRMKMGEVHLLGTHVYMVNEPPLVRRVLVDKAADYPKHRLLGEALAPLLGESIFTTNGAQWRRQREMMNPAFEQARLNAAFPRMLEAAQALRERLAALPDGAVHDVEIEMTHVTADIIFRTIFSKPMEGDDARRIFQAFARYQALAQRTVLPAIYGLRWLVPFWQRRASERAAAEIRGLLAGLIRPRFDAHRGGCPATHSDILESFLEARDKANGEPFGFEELLNQVAMLFLAGHETSASALTWALHLLANAPDLQQRAAEEVDRVVGAGGLSPEHLRELEFTRQVFRETLRLFPPVGFYAREADAPDSMRDKQLAVGSAVIISPWLIHRHRELWERPDEFDPDRFATASGRESMRGAYLPFSMGPRVCIGATFALQEAAVVLAMLLQTHRFEPAPGHVPQPVGRLTVRSGNGVLLKIFKRLSAGGTHHAVEP